jgi:hypothetical protein
MTSSFAHQTDSNAPYSQHHNRPPPKFGYCCKGDDFNKFYKTTLNYLENLSASCGRPNYNVVYTTHTISPTQSGGITTDYTLTPDQLFNSHLIVELDITDPQATKIVGPSSADVLAYFNGNPPNNLFFTLVITNNTTGTTQQINFQYITTQDVVINPNQTKIINLLVKSNGEVLYFPYTN